MRPGRRAPGRRDPGCAENHGIPGKIVGIGLAARYKPVQAWFVVILGTCSCTFFWTSQRFWPRDQTPTTKVQAASVDSNYYHLFQCKAYKIISISIHTELSSYGMCFEIACPSGMRWFVCAIKPYGSWAARSKKKYISTIQIPDSRLPLKPRARTQAPLAVARPQQSTQLCAPRSGALPLHNRTRLHFLTPAAAVRCFCLALAASSSGTSCCLAANSLRR